MWGVLDLIKIHFPRNRLTRADDVFGKDNVRRRILANDEQDHYSYARASPGVFR